VRPALAELEDADPATFAGYFVFADVLIWAHAYAIRLQRDATPCVANLVNSTAPVPVAESFAQFLEKYLWQPESLFPCGH